MCVFQSLDMVKFDGWLDDPGSCFRVHVVIMIAFDGVGHVLYAL